MIKKEEAQSIVVREWLQLPEEKRSDEEATIFAIKIANRQDLLFRTTGDRYQVVKGWLNRYTNNL